VNKKDVLLRQNTTIAVERKHTRDPSSTAVEAAGVSEGDGFDVARVEQPAAANIATQLSKSQLKERLSLGRHFEISISNASCLRAAMVLMKVLLNNFTATDVSQHGPLAWRNYFDPGPSFFMAVNGRMAFPTGAAASEGTEAFAKTIQHIELAWGDVRVDPLTHEFAMVAAPWREVQVDTAGHRVDESGFFRAITEYRGGRWQFRDAHWSSTLTGIKGF